MMSKEILEYWNLVLAELDIYNGSPSFSGTLYGRNELQIMWTGVTVTATLAAFPITSQGLCVALDWMKMKRAEYELLKTKGEAGEHKD